MSLEAKLAQYPRITLTRTPTPLDHLPHLSEQLGTNVYIKRDDLTDLTLGGDKPRKLEYELAQAQAQGADTLVTVGSAQSNNARLTTAAARKLGMQAALVLSRDRWEAFQGNLLTVYLMGARVEIVEADHWDLEQHALQLIETLKAEGRKPHYIPVSATSPLGCLGYVRAALEIVDQLKAQDIQLDAVYTPFGTGGIFTATLLTFGEKGLDCPIIGISVNRDRTQCLENIEKRWSELCELLDQDPSRGRGQYEVYDEFIGQAYGDPTDACLNAIVTMARSEGLLLDPVYSGKVFSGFLAHQAAGRWGEAQNTLILHTGGTPALFAYHEPLHAFLKNHAGLP